MASLVFNKELNGIELYFDKKPLQTIIDSLKNAGFRWHKFKKCWYAKQNKKTLELAQSIAGEQVKATVEEKTDKAYFPFYDSVDGSKILQDSNIELDTYNSYYFADINAYIHFYRDSAVLIDLTDALKAGKTCKRYYIEHKEWRNEGIWADLMNNGITTFKDLYNRTITGLNINTLKVTTTEEKAVNTFSPFVEIKPIKKPKKWTIAHVWKAILAGQIYKGVKDGHYTDDYAYDAVVNFQSGSRIHLPSLAKKVIENPSGWRVYINKEEDGITRLSFNCHSFDCNTLYFDEACNMQEAQRRKEQEDKERETYNNNLLAEVKTITENDIEKNSLYTVTYLEMDDNTNKYHKVTELLKGSRLFYEGEAQYQITDIQKYNIIDDRLYRVSDFYNRPCFKDDNRLISMGNWETICTGKALKELLQEGHSFPIVRESTEYKTFEDAINRIQAHLNGNMFWAFGEKTNYKESFKRLMKEVNRAVGASA